MLKDMLIDPTQELIEKYRKEGKIIEIDKVSRSNQSPLNKISGLSRET